MIPILYQDNDLVVVHKPPGLLVHKTNLDKYETEFALQIVRDQIGKMVYPVHRLDKPTSGCLVFALSSENAKRICKQFVEGHVKKEYLALVRGYCESVDLDYPLKEKKDPISDKKSRKNTLPQSAKTQIQSLERIEIPVYIDKYQTSRFSLVQAIPLTGRKHQIRRHLKHLGHPIIGDVEHGKRTYNSYFEKKFGFRRLMLHCKKISFMHPTTNEALNCHAPLDEDFLLILKNLGFHF